MQITLLLIGKTSDKYIQKLTDEYARRLQYYCKFEIRIVPELKSRKGLSVIEQKTKEGRAILKILQASDAVVLLDEKGKEFSSVSFSQWIQKQLNSGKKKLVFVVGGPFGFSDEVYARTHQKIALSKMTFPHELIRPFFVEQLYRAFTILKNEGYHHE